MFPSRFLRFAALLALTVLVVAGPTSAQNPEATVAPYPTVSLLNTTIVPPRDRVALAQELLGVGPIPPPPKTAPLRSVGDHDVFHVTNASEDRSISVNATLRAVGEHIYLWVEDGAQIDDAELQGLAQAFDERVYPNDRALWGSEANPGIDGDTHVYGLFTHDLGAGTAAYFVSEHTYPVQAVSTSNQHEMFFFNLDALGSHFDVRYVESVVAHEFQHMIRFNLQPNEDYWINEGYSTFTQLHFYDLPSWEILSFLGAPGTQLNTWAEDYGLRAQDYGAAVMFVTYFYDRFGLDALKQLSADHSTRALDAADRVLKSLGQPGVNDFFADWVAANFLIDPTLTNGVYGYKSIPSSAAGARAQQSVINTPWATSGTVNQYAADYYVLTNLRGKQSLEVRLAAPSSVELVPVQPHSGTHMWYSNKADVSSTTLTRAFDLTGVSTATLDYALWYQTEESWDYGYVMASGNDGKTWTILSSPHTSAANPHNTAYGPGYTGSTDGQWVDETVSLDAFAGKKTLVRFQMITDDAVTQPGMVIDDVSLPEIGYHDDFEHGGGDWQPEGWLLTDNRLPETTWVQAIQETGRQATVTRWQATGNGTWTLPLDPDVNQVVVAVSPFAPVTTVPMPYTLDVSAN